MRAFAGSVFAAIAAALVAGSVQAATWGPVLTPSAAAPGEEVTLTVDAIGGPATYGTDIYLIPNAISDGPPCTSLAGALKVGSLVWTIDGLNHHGVGHFTVPNVTDGDYGVGVDMTPFGCFGSGTLTVDADISDTAFGHASNAGGFVALVALLLAGAAVPLWQRRRALADSVHARTA